jgi:hypothetical protein
MASIASSRRCSSSLMYMAGLRLRRASRRSMTYWPSIWTHGALRVFSTLPTLMDDFW